MMVMMILLARVVDLVVAVPVLTPPMPPITVVAVLVIMMMVMTPVVPALWPLVSTRCSLPGLFFLPVRPCESGIDGYGCGAARLMLDSGILSYTNHLLILMFTYTQSGYVCLTEGTGLIQRIPVL